MMFGECVYINFDSFTLPSKSQQSRSEVQELISVLLLTFIPLFSVCDELLQLPQDHSWTFLIRSKCLHHCQYDCSMISTLKMECNAHPNCWCPPRKQYNQNMRGYKSIKKTRNQNLLPILHGQRCYHLQADDVCNFRWILLYMLV